MLVSLDGLHSGVPTRTTPTLTPTTLRNIEQTFYELQSSETLRQSSHQAGFVPPPAQQITQEITSRTSMSTSGSWQGPSQSEMDTTSQQMATTNTRTNRRSTGGRRPTKATNISPEEEERRCIRRERNKMAAARCRKRRMDHTNELIDETEQLERKRQTLQGEIHQLELEKQDLEFLLETHRACCKKLFQSGNNSRPESPTDIKPFAALLAASDPPLIKLEPLDDELSLPKESLSPNQDPVMNPDPIITKITSTPSVYTSTAECLVSKPNRPNLLNLPLTLPPSQTQILKNVPEIAGIPITTPSTGIPFNFESLMEGGTGLTPVSGPLTPNSKNPSTTKIFRIM
ncbi:transcription factor kayak [Ctenocephalides felis]|uniref:transcription factor kayak n=1 Tax=Ctenocephalides felis TaxID=7515 RepID=UPI000E6E256C|nr:transcription factor kayak [Ctenocephalides felis]